MQGRELRLVIGSGSNFVITMTLNMLCDGLWRRRWLAAGIEKWIVAVPEPFDLFLVSCLCYFVSQEALTSVNDIPSNTLIAVWDVEDSQ